MIPVLLELAVWVVSTAFVLMGVTYLYSTTRSHSQSKDRKPLSNLALLILVFTCLSLYGTYTGIKYSGAIINVRDFGALMAGFLGGPVAGLIVGIIAGLHRYSMGGITAIPCAIATTLAGLLAGLIHQLKGHKFPGVAVAAVSAACMEGIHMGLILLLAQPYEKAFEIVTVISAPMVLANFLAMLAVAHIIERRPK